MNPSNSEILEEIKSLRIDFTKELQAQRKEFSQELQAQRKEFTRELKSQRTEMQSMKNYLNAHGVLLEDVLRRIDQLEETVKNNHDELLSHKDWTGSR